MYVLCTDWIEYVGFLNHTFYHDTDSMEDIQIYSHCVPVLHDNHTSPACLPAGSLVACACACVTSSWTMDGTLGCCFTKLSPAQEKEERTDGPRSLVL